MHVPLTTHIVNMEEVIAISDVFHVQNLHYRQTRKIRYLMLTDIFLAAGERRHRDKKQVRIQNVSRRSTCQCALLESQAKREIRDCTMQK